ncbi:MAG: universal stress protein [Candidatus Handelsmanbacteria bacterium]|nr:universal stress protein [Candidatus Handelsmanbacteria bacterium]
MGTPEIKHVLAAVDFSEWTPPVLRGGAVLVLLQVAEGASPLPDPEQLCALVTPARRAGCALRALGRRGEAAEQILQAAAKEKSDLIVLGAQHRPLLETTIFGTTSVRVMRHAPAAVLTVVRAQESAGDKALTRCWSAGRWAA